MHVEKINFTDDWSLFILKNDGGMEVHVLNFGGIITKIVTEDRYGKFENVVLGYQNYEDYATDSNFLGAIIGRVAGRIKDAQFSLNNESYGLESNDGKNHLHGGSLGLHNALWEGNTFQLNDKVGVALHYVSQDGESGYPGNVTITVTYSLTNDNELILDYCADTDKTTPLALTNHSYFNLTGDLHDTIHNHHITMACDRFAELGAQLMPTGKFLDVIDTPFDFKGGRKLKDGIFSGYSQNKIAGNGYDHYFEFNKNKDEKVIVKDDTSGRVLKVRTNQPGMVMYTANNLEPGLPLLEKDSQKYLGVCFETQALPAPLYGKELPAEVIVKAGEEYQYFTVFRFEVED
ncbi:aldose epimerase family protein [Salinicoccus albus]|uniref:aldose epimerase family protein n=1 Tax=Salinicoccus albus TaxID=418756 RepID=UPI0003681F93|nr:aldose epimerase family protein [Salinicoccus albus]